MRFAFAAVLLFGWQIAGCTRQSSSPTPSADLPSLTQKDVASDRPIAVPIDGYVGSDACRSCHADQHESWYSSWHRTMTQVATSDTVIGDFDCVLEHDGKSFELSESGGQVWVDTTIPSKSGAAANYRRPVVMSTGSHHMQAYWFSIADDSRVLAMMPFIHLREGNRWIPRNSAFLKPSRPLTDEVGRWNHTCIKCHVTNGRFFGPDLKDPAAFKLRDADTQVSEFGISCEACHGSGQKHVELYTSLRQDSETRPRPLAPLISNPASLDHKRASQICGQCHGVFGMHEHELASWMKQGWKFRPGENLDESPMRYLVRCDAEYKAAYATWPTTFWSDGMVRVSGREYNGLSESPCFTKGELSCLHCHQMHLPQDDPRPVKEWANDQLSSHAIGNFACTQCHKEYETDDFLRAHTHHKASSTGSDCQNCHMPHTTYGLLKAIRSHQIDSPDVSVSLRTGRPNACNLCHLDQTISWTADRLNKWYEQPLPELDADQKQIAATVLSLLKGNAGERALVAWTCGWEPAQSASSTAWIPPYLARLLNDPYDAVRFIAQRSLKTLPGFSELEYDFVGSAVEREEAVSQSISIWENAGEAFSPAISRRVLMRSDGKTNVPVIMKLLNERDITPMRLAE